MDDLGLEPRQACIDLKEEEKSNPPNHNHDNFDQCSYSSSRHDRSKEGQKQTCHDNRDSTSDPSRHEEDCGNGDDWDHPFLHGLLGNEKPFVNSAIVPSRQNKKEELVTIYYKEQEVENKSYAVATTVKRDEESINHDDDDNNGCFIYDDNDASTAPRKDLNCSESETSASTSSRTSFSADEILSTSFTHLVSYIWSLLSLQGRHLEKGRSSCHETKADIMTIMERIPEEQTPSCDDDRSSSKISIASSSGFFTCNDGSSNNDAASFLFSDSGSISSTKQSSNCSAYYSASFSSRSHKKAKRRMEIFIPDPSSYFKKLLHDRAISINADSTMFLQQLPSLGVLEGFQLQDDDTTRSNNSRRTHNEEVTNGDSTLFAEEEEGSPPPPPPSSIATGPDSSSFTIDYQTYELRRLLARRSTHLPGHDWKADWIQYISNNHLLLGICFKYKEHPIGLTLRVPILFGSIFLELALTNIVYLHFANVGDDQLHQYSTVAQGITSLVVGSVVHPLIDFLIWNLTACCICVEGERFSRSECVTVGRFLAISLCFLFTILGSLTSLVRGIYHNHPSLDSFKEEDMQNIMDGTTIFWIEFVEHLGLSYFVTYPIITTMTILGWIPCVRGRRDEIIKQEHDRNQLQSRNVDDGSHLV